MNRTLASLGVSLIVLMASQASAQQLDNGDSVTEAGKPGRDHRYDEDILVEGRRDKVIAGTKTDTPLIEVPQPITVIPAEVYLSQGAVTVSETIRYAAGVSSGMSRDTRRDSFTIRGITAQQFRDGMRDVFNFDATITSDPYNFSRVEVVRGPASVLFGQGSIGGIVNLVSKTPVFENVGEARVTYGSFNRKELMTDYNLAAGDTVAARIVARIRDADTFVDQVPDDRVMLAPSIRWRVTPDTDVTLLGLYQEDKTASSLNFLPVIGTLRPNRDNPRLARGLFLGRPGYDRFNGTLKQGTGLVTHHFSDDVKLSLKARYIDSDVSYFSHYTDSYTNPVDPYVPGSNGRRIVLTASSSLARLNIFSTDNNVQARFNTGSAIEHTLLAGLDYSWNRVRKASVSGNQIIDIYDFDPDSILALEVNTPFSNDSQKQLGVYVQDQIRLWDRVSIVLGARRDDVQTTSLNTKTGVTTRKNDKATTFRAGIIGDIGANLSPFFSYTESFLPLAGSNSDGAPFKPQTGTQYEAGVKWQPDAATLVTFTAFHIRDANRAITLPGNIVTQAGEMKTKGVELEATRNLPGNLDLSVAYGFNDATGDFTSTGYVPRHTASAWANKAFNGDLGQLRLGAGVRYVGSQVSTNRFWSIRSPSVTMVDALVEFNRDEWRLALNATNLFDNRTYTQCLARGDCFNATPRNAMVTLGYRFQ